MRRYQVLLFWTAFAVVSFVQTWVSMLDHGHSPLRMLSYQLIVWLSWAAITIGIFRLTERFPLAPIRHRLSIPVHTCAALLVSVGHVAWWMFLSVSMRPYDDMTAPHFWPIYPRALITQIILELLLYFGAVAVAHAKLLARRAAELERSLERARLHALELQIQPHFLFNTLNAVSSLVRAKQNAEAVEVIAGLSDLLRYTLDHAGEQRVSLEQETDMLQRYLGIQRVRFADRLAVQIDVADNARRAAVPTLILQPLAENAIRHGIAPVASAGRVEMRAFRTDDALRIEMFNTGKLDLKKRGIGLTNTEERLRQLYGSAHRFDLLEIGGGVLASICIPWSEVA
jgi:two-component system, LytTR family, sensor kinase